MTTKTKKSAQHPEQRATAHNTIRTHNPYICKFKTHLLQSFGQPFFERIFLLWQCLVLAEQGLPDPRRQLKILFLFTEQICHRFDVMVSAGHLA